MDVGRGVWELSESLRIGNSSLANGPLMVSSAVCMA